MNKCVSYFRVSTNRQGVSGLGLDGQREAVQGYLATGNWHLIGEFSEVESGKVKDRPQLKRALELCRKEKATLLIAKLDRLSRNALFLLSLQESGVNFTAVDMPFADKFTISILGLVAQKEREMISERTRVALAAAKRRGKRLGNPHFAKAVQIARKVKTENANLRARQLAPVIKEITERAHVSSLFGIAQVLNARGYRTCNGKEFAAQSIKNLLARIKSQAVQN